MEHAYWYGLSEEELAKRDIAEVNLAIAEGLPGAENLDVGRCLAKLDRWAAKVKSFTDRQSHQFRRVPEEHDNSFAQFCILCMVTVLQRDLGVHYDPQSMAGDFDASDSRRLFLHGPLQGHGGTCVNLPVLYIAVGRRLGYPLRLVEAKDHLFVRWVGRSGERFNIEATSKGFIARDDAHYVNWPKPLTARDLVSPQYLQNKSHREVMAGFVAERGRCHLDNLRLDKAIWDLDTALVVDSSHQGKLVVAEMMARILERYPIPELPRSDRWKVLLEASTPAPINDHERWAIPHAQQELMRIFKFAHKQHRLRWNLPERKFSSVSAADLFTEIIA